MASFSIAGVPVSLLLGLAFFAGACFTAGWASGWVAGLTLGFGHRVVLRAQHWLLHR